MKVRELHDNSAIQLNLHAARPCSSTLNFSDMPESREALEVLVRQKGAGKVQRGVLREGSQKSDIYGFLDRPQNGGNREFEGAKGINRVSYEWLQWL